MIGALSGGEGLGSASGAYFAQQAQGIKGLGAVSGLTGGEGAGGAAQSSATISGAAQLLSNLQQLQTEDPTKFQQVVSQIVGQLQAAAQQTQGPQSTFLSNLAAKFQSVANGGSLSQLQPQHHHHHAQQAYSQGAQNQSQGVTGLAQSSNGQSSSSSTLQQLYATISNEVSQALAA
jgi:hypothetical protein